MSRKASLGTVGDVNKLCSNIYAFGGSTTLHSRLERMIRVPDRFVIIARQYYWNRTQLQMTI